VGQPASPISIPADANVGICRHQPRYGRYLFYTFTTEQGWTLGLAALADNKTIELTGAPRAAARRCF